MKGAAAFGIVFLACLVAPQRVVAQRLVAIGPSAWAVAGNQYAQAHKPACVYVPAGPPCRYLDTDNSAMHRTSGIVLGAGLGATVGVLLAR